MPHKKKPRRYITPLVLFTLAGWALWALGRNDPISGESPDAESSAAPDTTGPSSPTSRPRATWSKRRLATSLAFATLFFGGAAFSAGAGDVVAEALEGDTTTEAVSTEEVPAEEPAAEEENQTGGEEAEQPADDPPAEGEDPGDGGEEPDEQGQQTGGNNEPPADDGGDPSDGGQNPGDGGQNPGDGGEPGDGTPPPPLPDDPGDGNDAPDPPASPDPGVGDGPASSPPPDDLPVIDKGTWSPAYLDPEASAADFFATVWLHRPLPDPTPPAKRLKQWFANALAHESKDAGVDWALVLGVLRARGFDSSSMSLDPVRTTAARLVELRAGHRTPLGMARAYGGDEFAREAMALRNYNRAVGLRSLVEGFEASKARLGRMTLRDKRFTIYPGGRLDIAMGRVDVRVLVLLRYLAEAHGQVTVSCLMTGHGLYARPGVISAHIYGLAVDIAALEGKSIYGNQEPGGVTERAVRNILRLPAELQAKQVISLLGLGGPSFPLADHDDHIHVGY